MRLILLGEGCQISWDVEKLEQKKDATGLFEWFLSVKFSDINYILRKICNNDIIRPWKKVGFSDVFMDETDIRTTHIKYNEFEETVNRRAKRMIEFIKNSDRILFIRHEHSSKYTEIEEIEEFVNIIKEINKECDFKILLFKSDNNNKKLIHETLYYMEYKDRQNLSNIIDKIKNGH
jgi:hypothetical protein